MYSEYLTINPERARSTRPKGFKHFRADNDMEHLLLGLHMLLHRLNVAFYGGDLYE